VLTCRILQASMVADTWVCDHRMNLEGYAVMWIDGDLHIADKQEGGSIPSRMLCDTG
jgi:hypothetical protein